MSCAFFGFGAHFGARRSRPYIECDRLQDGEQLPHLRPTDILYAGYLCRDGCIAWIERQESFDPHRLWLVDLIEAECIPKHWQGKMDRYNWPPLALLLAHEEEHRRSRGRRSIAVAINAACSG